ncbi:MAG: hypothetical protein HWN68_20780 [Desulfobacterales bacterium]|nr:hypothetical protein [Desulfobacterales bacterium]
MPRINELYAFIVEDQGPDDEGIIALKSTSETTGEGVWLPLAGADMARVESLRPFAEGIGRKVKKKVKLCKFDRRQELEEI